MASRRWIKRWIKCRSIEEVKQPGIVIQAKKSKGTGRVVTGILGLTRNPFERLNCNDFGGDLQDCHQYCKHDQKTIPFQVTIEKLDQEHCSLLASRGTLAISLHIS